MTLKWRILSDIHLGNLDRAVSSGDWALKTARSMEDEPILGAILIRNGLIAKARGRSNKAIKLFNEAAELHRSRNENHIRVESLCYLSELYLQNGNLSEAEDCAEEIVQIISSGDGHLILDSIAAHFAVYRVFDATSDKRASDHLRSARTFLDTRSDGITDGGLRRAYRENHAIHRSIIDLTAGES
jgi:tetratricopeptide (TPR) repeat protein